ncbi:hypothetical protein TSUD_325900 [Trifolium subterraneum]|uniref:Uncharacterized protein n=1 Tax=Trifolium subterraneum TaxID=3900 RepID=A0A2Z6LM52_TRISU|nr:hypothetical protein TSUD_325900 [Trifolium subterraneum]
MVAVASPEVDRKPFPIVVVVNQAVSVCTSDDFNGGLSIRVGIERLSSGFDESDGTINGDRVDGDGVPLVVTHLLLLLHLQLLKFHMKNMRLVMMEDFEKVEGKDIKFEVVVESEWKSEARIPDFERSGYEVKLLKNLGSGVYSLKSIESERHVSNKSS